MKPVCLPHKSLILSSFGSIFDFLREPKTEHAAVNLTPRNAPLRIFTSCLCVFDFPQDEDYVYRVHLKGGDSFICFSGQNFWDKGGAKIRLSSIARGTEIVGARYVNKQGIRNEFPESFTTNHIDASSCFFEIDYVTDAIERQKKVICKPNVGSEEDGNLLVCTSDRQYIMLG